MDISMIPAAVAEGIRAHLIATPPSETFPIGEDAIFLQNVPDELVSPRIEILTKDATRVPQMDATGRQPVELRLVTSLDDTTPANDHGLLAGALDAWWRSLRSNRAPGNFERCHVHDVLFQPPVIAQQSEKREVISVFRGDWMVTLYDPASLI